jgi:two-component system, NtrC family, sensor kinase
MICSISRWLNRCSLRLRLVLFVFVPLVGTIFVLGFSVLSHLEKEGERRMQKEVELIARVLQAPLTHALAASLGKAGRPGPGRRRGGP